MAGIILYNFTKFYNPPISIYTKYIYQKIFLQKIPTQLTKN
jgi:hypothetical protein